MIAIKIASTTMEIWTWVLSMCGIYAFRIILIKTGNFYQVGYTVLQLKKKNSNRDHTLVSSIRSSSVILGQIKCLK